MLLYIDKTKKYSFRNYQQYYIYIQSLSHNHCSKLDEHLKIKINVVDSRRNVPYNNLGERSSKIVSVAC